MFALKKIAATLFTGFLAATGAQAAPVTDCSPNGICYCIESAFKPVLDAQVVKLRALLAQERALGKAIGYQSIPLSTIGGGFFNINRDVGEATKKRVEARLGASQTYLLAPGNKESEIPNVGGARPSGTEYMVMWTALLEGPDGLGRDFDYVYFVGPNDFSQSLGLTGTGDMDKINEIYAQRLATDPELKSAVDKGRITPQSFRNYYGLRASVSVSLGAHDEWNIFATINKKRRADVKFGLPNQIPMWFDGKGVSPADAEMLTSLGYQGACKAP